MLRFNPFRPAHAVRARHQANCGHGWRRDARPAGHSPHAVGPRRASALPRGRACRASGRGSALSRGPPAPSRPGGAEGDRTSRPRGVAGRRRHPPRDLAPRRPGLDARRQLRAARQRRPLLRRRTAADSRRYSRASSRGRARPTLLARLEVVIDGRVWQSRVLNDVLVCHESPAATTRYEITTDAGREVHRSSGIWIATPAGSTAAIRSAGGRALPAGSRRLQYRVRELYREPGRSYRLTGAVLAEGQAIAVVSRMPEGRLYADGARLCAPVHLRIAGRRSASVTSPCASWRGPRGHELRAATPRAGPARDPRGSPAAPAMRPRPGR